MRRHSWLRRGLHLEELQAAEGFERVQSWMMPWMPCWSTTNQAPVPALADTVDRLFHAILPDPAANRFGPDRKAIVVIADKIRSLIPAADISEVMGAVEDLLDELIVPTKAGYVIREPAKGGQSPGPWPDRFRSLERQFEKSRKHIEAERLRGSLSTKLRQMLRLNRTRMDYYQRLQELIDLYNAGAKNVDAFYAELITLAQNLNVEEQRTIAESLPKKS